MKVATDVICVSSSAGSKVPARATGQGYYPNTSGPGMEDAMRKISELQEQVRKQDKYMKSKILRDKTNTEKAGHQIHQDDAVPQLEAVVTDSNKARRHDHHILGEAVKDRVRVEGKSRSASFTRRRSGGANPFISPNFGVENVCP